ncbi:MAG: imidazole glycerol phosphate synthase subunit HisH [Fimbriimonadaceae bacterium]|nr:imidazole glycerol phosphate synthase subunit HisH [Alphaproteobacteria bacterium]
MAKVGIVDYGMGNLISLAGAIEHLQHEPFISHKAADLAKADRLILPGVGAFPDAMRNLRERKLVETLNELVMVQSYPILGICLGAQLIARDSEEYGQHPGLGWIDASVRRIELSDPAIRVPHVGWNDLERRREGRLLRGIPEDALFYYVHSFCIPDAPDATVLGYCDYGTRFAAALEVGNIFATQFHPEKSQRYGLAVLSNFIEAR